jgi:hypothetical protein
MGYQKVYGDLEDFAKELKETKARQAFFRLATEQVPVEGTRGVQLEDGTIGQEDVKGMRFTSTITLTALSFVSVEPESKIQGASFNIPKPDTQMVFTAPIAQKECFSGEDKSEFDKEVEANWKAIIKEVGKMWSGSFYEGVVSIVG